MLSKQSVNDAGLKELAPLQNLRSLRINGTESTGHYGPIVNAKGLTETERTGEDRIKVTDASGLASKQYRTAAGKTAQAYAPDPANLPTEPPGPPGQPVRMNARPGKRRVLQTGRQG